MYTLDYKKEEKNNNTYTFSPITEQMFHKTDGYKTTFPQDYFQHFE